MQYTHKAGTCNNCCSAKAILHILSVFVQHAMHMRRVRLSSVACQVVQDFPTLYHKQLNFQKRGYRT
jgi:hypothetical protein